MADFASFPGPAQLSVACRFSVLQATESWAGPGLGTRLWCISVSYHYLFHLPAYIEVENAWEEARVSNQRVGRLSM